MDTFHKQVQFPARNAVSSPFRPFHTEKLVLFQGGMVTINNKVLCTTIIVLQGLHEVVSPDKNTV